MVLDLISKVLLSDICNIKYGKDHKKLNDGSIPVYGTGGIMRYVDSILYDKESVLIPRKGTLGNLFYVDEPFWSIDTLFYTEIDQSQVIPKYLFYKLKTLDLENMNVGTAVPSLTTALLNEIELNLPSLSYQQKTVNILTSFDNKIENNKAIITNLEEQAQEVFKYWFVDFKPFQEKEFVESQLGKIPLNWEIKELGEFFPIKTGKKNANIATENGKYPFFTCSQNISYTDDYSFDAQAILLAGNGDFNVKRFKGKFEAYQRTYVLIPNNKNYTGLLYYLINYYLEDLVSGYKGSVINYITKGMIENFKFPFPKDIENIEILEIFNTIERKIAILKKENNKLVKIRDVLLPKLMSGEFQVEEVVEIE